MKLSVIIATHNRPNKLRELLACLRKQNLACEDYEIIVVDDGSTPPVVLPDEREGPACVLIRLEGLERSAARNAGAAAANGEMLVFLDDDLAIPADFLEAHLEASKKWPGTLQVGAIRLPGEALTAPFGRFRQRLEDHEVPQVEGPINAPNFCTAQNMAIDRLLFQRLGGFEVTIVSSEDQDFALRHTAAGGKIVFVPKAMAIHHDSALDIRTYCRRNQWGAENLIPFCRRYPDWSDNVERQRVNGFHDWGRGSVSQGLRKVLKAALASRPVTAGLFCMADGLERVAPNSRILERIYRLLLGAHIFRGYRNGLKRFTL